MEELMAAGASVDPLPEPPAPASTGLHWPRRR
jgi:hypothetical protein